MFAQNMLNLAFDVAMCDYDIQTYHVHRFRVVLVSVSVLAVVVVAINFKN